MWRCTCWKTEPMWPRRKQRSHGKHWTRCTSRPCSLKRAHRGKCYRWVSVPYFTGNTHIWSEPSVSVGFEAHSGWLIYTAEWSPMIATQLYALYFDFEYNSYSIDLIISNLVANCSKRTSFSVLDFLLGHCLGRLWTNGPQILHGSSTNPIGGTGPGQQRDWLVQTVPALLLSRPHSSVSD